MATIVEFWADTGRVVERDFTKQELFQQKIDFEQEEALLKEQKRVIEQVNKTRLEALAHAKSLGFNDDMIKIMYPNLIIE